MSESTQPKTFDPNSKAADGNRNNFGQGGQGKDNKGVQSSPNQRSSQDQANKYGQNPKAGQRDEDEEA